MAEARKSITRVQTGVRIERGVLKTLKILAAEKEMSLGDLLEGIVLHAFEGKAAFGPESLKRIAEIKKTAGLRLTAQDSHNMIETKGDEGETT